jgi:hypothetical protein
MMYGLPSLSVMSGLHAAFEQFLQILQRQCMPPWNQINTPKYDSGTRHRGSSGGIALFINGCEQDTRQVKDSILPSYRSLSRLETVNLAYCLKSVESCCSSYIEASTPLPVVHHFRGYGRRRLTWGSLSALRDPKVATVARRRSDTRVRAMLTRAMDDQ